MEIKSNNYIAEILKEASNTLNLDATKIPIKYDETFIETKGQIDFIILKDTMILPKEFIFSKMLLDDIYDKEYIKYIVKHEYAHLYTNLMNNEICGHDERFKETCKKLGIDDFDLHKNYVINEKNISKYYKYKICCSKCNAIFYKNEIKKDYITEYKCSHCLGDFVITDIINN